MANTYKKVYLHIIFAVKNRKALLGKSWRHRLFIYISKSLKNRGHYPLAVNGHVDHVHLFFDYSCQELISDLVREIKKSSNQFISEENLTPFKFDWQSGYGVFSNSAREKDTIIKYIMNQEDHHSSKSFRDEYLTLLKRYEIEFKDEYVFEFFEDL